MEFVQYNWLYALIGFIIYLIMLSLSRPLKTYYAPQTNNGNYGVKLFFILYVINSVFALWEWDTYHIWDDFIREGQYANFEIWGYEGIYNWLASKTGAHYFLWRFIVWTPACLFIYYTAKRLRILNNNFILALALFAGFAAYTRGMLGHTMLVFGAVLVFDDKSSKFTKLLGILVVGVSYFFHKSMYVNIIFALIALIPFGKRTIVISLVLFPLMTFVARYLVDGIAGGMIDMSMGEGVGGVGDRTLRYVSGEQLEANTRGLIGRTITYTPEYLCLYYLCNRIAFKNYFDNIPNKQVFKYLFRLTFVIFYIASLFAFVDTSSWIYLRFKYMAFFPLIFVLGRVLMLEKKRNYWVRFIIILQLFAIFFKYLLLIRNWMSL